MPSFGQKSLKNLFGVHPDIIDVLEEAIKYYDFSVLEGVRSPERQEELFNTTLPDGSRATQTLNSKHLRQSDGYSHAVDIAPYPIDWEDKRRFAHLAGFILGIAKMKGVNLVWGNDWDSDGDLNEHKLQDGPHFELRK